MSTEPETPIDAMARAVSAMTGKVMSHAITMCDGNYELATMIVRAAATDMEAIQRADFINATYAERKRRADQQEGAGHE